MSIWDKMSGAINGSGNSSNTYTTGGLDSTVYGPRDFHHQYDHLSQVFYFRVGYATIIVPMQIAHVGGTYEVGKERYRRKNVPQAEMISEWDPKNVQNASDDCCTPDVVCNQKDVPNTAKPKKRKDLCSKFLYEG